MNLNDYYKEEYLKCWKDKSRAYFICNYLETFNADISKKTAFKVFPRQRVFLQSLVDNKNTIAIKHRQAGISTVSAAWISGEMTFADIKSPETVLCIANKLEQAEELVQKIVEFLDQVPRWMWGTEYFSPDPKDKINTKSIYVKRNKNNVELFNGCKIYARASGESAARGISAVSILIFDEAAFIENGKTVYAQAVAATSSVANAKIIMVSTPHGKDELYYSTYANALAKKNNYTAVEFKWFQDPRYNRNLKWYKKNEETNEIEWIKEETIGPRGEIKYDEERWRKLENDGWKPESPWYTGMCLSFNNDEQRIAQELDVSFLGSSDNVVPPDIIEAQKRENVIDITEDWPLKDPFEKDTWIWEDPIPGHRYLIGVDPSSGAGSDGTAIQVIDVDAVDENNKPFYGQSLEYYGKKTGDEIGVLVERYARIYNDALVVIEAIGGYADAALLTLLQLKYTNIYYDDPSLKTYTNEKLMSKFKTYTTDDKLPGFRSSAFRTQMIELFKSMVKENMFRIRSSRVISQLDTWIYKNGRPDHMSGFHDDLLTCLSMSLFIIERYMLKNDHDRSMTQTIIKSWKKSSSFTERKEDINDIDISVRKPLPFFSNRALEKEKNKKVNAMLLLGGYRKPKKY